MTVYIVATLKIHDRDRYAEYESGFMEIFSRYQGSLLAVEEAPEVLEGDWDCTRTVLVSFPSREELMLWYESEDYQALVQHRFAASEGSLVVLNGLEM